MVSKRKSLTATAATFGAALSTIYAANELQADIVDVTFSANSAIAGGGTISFQMYLGTATATFLLARNDYPGTSGVGQGYNGLIGGNIGFQMANVPLSQTLTPGGTTFPGGLFAYTGGVFAGSVNYVGFSFGGNVGWFSVDFTNPNVFSLVSGQYGNSGESVHVGAGVIPEPSTTGLALLALGAIGVRRHRKKAAAA